MHINGATDAMVPSSRGPPSIFELKKGYNVASGASSWMCVSPHRLGSLLIKLTQVKVRMVFDMKCMKLTGKHIAPHCRNPPTATPTRPNAHYTGRKIYYYLFLLSLNRLLTFVDFLQIFFYNFID